MYGDFFSGFALRTLVFGFGPALVLSEPKQMLYIDSNALLFSPGLAGLFLPFFIFTTLVPAASGLLCTFLGPTVAFIGPVLNWAKGGIAFCPAGCVFEIPGKAANMGCLVSAGIPMENGN
jgi:hypothetical protein